MNIKTFKYTIFNRDNWNYNIDKIFFILSLSMMYITIKMFMVNFNVSGFELVVRVLVTPFVVVAAFAFIEGLFAIMYKVALEPGSILESKFRIFKIFFNTYIQSSINIFTFKQVIFTREIVIGPVIYTPIVSPNFTGEISLNGFLKEPEHFKY